MNKFRSSSTNHFSFSFHPSDFSSSFFPNTLLPLSHPTQPNKHPTTNQTRPDTLWFPKAVILAIRRRWATAAAPFLCRCWFKACCRASEVAASLQMACKPREPKRLSCAPVMVEGRRTSPSQKKKGEAWFFRVGGKGEFFWIFALFLQVGFWKELVVGLSLFLLHINSCEPCFPFRPDWMHLLDSKRSKLSTWYN